MGQACPTLTYACCVACRIECVCDLYNIASCATLFDVSLYSWALSKESCCLVMCVLVWLPVLNDQAGHVVVTRWLRATCMHQPAGSCSACTAHDGKVSNTLQKVIKGNAQPGTCMSFPHHTTTPSHVACSHCVFNYSTVAAQAACRAVEPRCLQQLYLLA